MKVQQHTHPFTCPRLLWLLCNHCWDSSERMQARRSALPMSCLSRPQGLPEPWTPPMIPFTLSETAFLHHSSREINISIFYWKYLWLNNFSSGFSIPIWLHIFMVVAHTLPWVIYKLHLQFSTAFIWNSNTKASPYPTDFHVLLPYVYAMPTIQFLF